MAEPRPETKLGEIEAQLPGGILLIHSDLRSGQAEKFQQEVSAMGIFIARQGQLANLPPEKLRHFIDIAKFILILPDEALDRPTSDLLEHIIKNRGRGYAQVMLSEEDKINRSVALLADRQLDWTSDLDQERVLRTFNRPTH
ncbi:MAG: hypothetical protein WC841_05130 [Candidatus Shapirobacteria bacterium]|jgi:hypothetical protein